MNPTPSREAGKSHLVLLRFARCREVGHRINAAERRTPLTCIEAFAKGFDPASGDSINSDISGESENRLTYTNQALATNSCFGFQIILHIRKLQTLSGRRARGEVTRLPRRGRDDWTRKRGHAPRRARQALSCSRRRPRVRRPTGMVCNALGCAVAKARAALVSSSIPNWCAHSGMVLAHSSRERIGSDWSVCDRQPDLPTVQCY